MLSLRTKLILTCALLVLALICAGFAAETVIRSLQNFHQQETLTRAGDVRTIRPWMTVPYVAHTYHIPESYLYQALKLPASHTSHRTTLHAIALSQHKPVDAVVHTVQTAIKTYRKEHAHGLSPQVRQPHLDKSPLPGRTTS